MIAEFRQVPIRIMRQLMRVATLVILAAGASGFAIPARAQAAGPPRPRLLEGSVYWVGNPLAKKKSTDTITAISFSPDGKRLVFGDDSGRITTVDARHGRKLASSMEHDSPVVSIVFRPGQDAYFTAAKTGPIREALFTNQPPVDIRAPLATDWTSVAISPNGKLLAVAEESYGKESAIRVYDTETGSQTLAIRSGPDPAKTAFGPDSQFLLGLVHEASRVAMWNAMTGDLVWSRGDDRVRQTPGIDGTFLADVVFGPREDEYVVAIDNPWQGVVIDICSLETGQVRHELTSRFCSSHVAISPDRNWVAAGGYFGAVEIWDATTGQRACQFYGNQEFIQCVAFSPDSRFIASADANHTVIVWDIGSAATAHRVSK